MCSGNEVERAMIARLRTNGELQKCQKPFPELSGNEDIYLFVCETCSRTIEFESKDPRRDWKAFSIPT